MSKFNGRRKYRHKHKYPKARLTYAEIQEDLFLRRRGRRYRETGLQILLFLTGLVIVTACYS